MNLPKFYDSKSKTFLGVKVTALSLTVFIIAILLVLKSVLQFPLTVFDGIKKGLGFGQDTPTDKNIDSVIAEIKKDPDVKLQNQAKAVLIAEQLATEITGFTYSMSSIKDAFKQINSIAMMKAVYAAYGKRKNTQVLGLSIFPQTDLVSGLKSKLWSGELNEDVSHVLGQKITILNKLNWVKS